MLYPLDTNGCVINEASLDKINSEYRPLIDGVIDALRGKLSDKLQSIYVRGSVSVGRAKPHISDVDMVAIMHGSLTEEETKWRRNLSETLGAQYPFVTLVDLTCITLEELNTAEEYRRLRVYLATQSVCLYGRDILDDLGKVKPDKRLALQMYQGLDIELEGLKEYFLDSSAVRSYLGEVRPPKFWCVWTMRVLLRSGLGLVMCDRPAYSQDLQTCCAEFIKVYPEYESKMEQALEWAHKPIGDKERLATYMSDFIPKYISLWRAVGL